ncbi:hypothetical protein D1872_294970 [compost metagenome]
MLLLISVMVQSVACMESAFMRWITVWYLTVLAMPELTYTEQSSWAAALTVSLTLKEA